ncbi:hypothetical protein [Streptomyces sp. NPDC089799]|uniref:hypothetical protein n=1 Tax=Streptomyces sp. NPDC089799 TaxID=3155066 RepID=UPI003431BFDA
MSVIDPAVSVHLGAADARRLVGLLAEVSRLLEDPGPDRLTEAQVRALAGSSADRRELAERTRNLAAELRGKL